MAQDAGQAGARLPDLVTLQRSQLVLWLDERRQFRRERDALAAQVEALKHALSEALVHWSDASVYAYHDAPFPHEHDNSRPAQRYRALLALSATPPAPAAAGQEGERDADR